jgi:ABC-2 type transport system permease protein
MIIGFGALIGFMFKLTKRNTNLKWLTKAEFAGQLKSTKDITYTFVPTNTENALVKNLKELKGSDGILIIRN